MIRNSIQFAVAGKSSSGDQQTGLYFCLSTYYNFDDTTTVPSLSYFGDFTVRGNLDCYNDAHIVASSPVIDSLTDDDLSNWECSVHEAFNSYPSTGLKGFEALAIADGVTGPGTQNFANGHYGVPYILSRGATPAGCGDGKWDKSLGEECDDGNTKDNDGCSKSCKCESGSPRGDGTCNGKSVEMVRMPGPFLQVDYFTGVYLCIIITVLFKTLWGIVLASTKMIEPFYQLHKSAGASAKESLLSGYLASGLSLESFKNIFRQHWVMTLTTAVYVVATASMAVASETMTIRSGNNCTTPDDPIHCDLQWVIDVKIVRALEGLMGLVACMILLRIIFSWNRTSGVYSYPCTIASMAALLSNPAITDSFLRIDPEARSKDIAKSLSTNHYALRQFETSRGNVRYGLTQIAAPQTSHWWQSSSSQSAPAPNTEKRSKSGRVRSILEALLHALFLAIHLVLLGIFLFYRLSHNPTLFINKTHFGPRFLLTITTTLLSIQWARLEREVRIMTPYRRLSKPNAKSQHLIDMSLHGVPLTTFFYALWYGNFYHAYVALTEILSNFLIIAVVGIPYNFGIIQDVSLFSSTACLGLVGFMTIAAASIFWWRWTNPSLPRKPDTLANVMMMLCASKMLELFDGLGQNPAQSRDLEIRTAGRQYRFGKQHGIDEKERAMIEVVEVDDEVGRPPGM